MSDKVEFNQRFGEHNGKAKLTERQVAKIRASDLPAVRLAELYGVSDIQIRRIRKGQSWRDPSTSMS